MEIKIEKGVPIPERLANGKKRAHYPFNAMEIGDSFVVKDIKKAYLQTLSKNWKRMHERKWVFKVATEGEEDCRIWRIA
ncbi:MAG: hypothetical protein AABY22_13095 [Nanoarchaeota archaeon]